MLETNVVELPGPVRERAVCEHLAPLLDRLVHRHGLHLIARTEALGCGLGFLLDGELPFEELAALERPPFVHVIVGRRVVFCERCWQSLGEWWFHKDQWT